MIEIEELDCDRRYASFRNILLHVIVVLSSFKEIFHCQSVSEKGATKALIRRLTTLVIEFVESFIKRS